MVTGHVSPLMGLIGYPLGHSLSPLMHNAAFRQLGLDYHYTLFPVARDQLANALTGIRALQIMGCNITIPYKEAVLPLLDAVDPLAQAIGAVNTIVNEQGQLHGYNTDGIGFLRSLREELRLNPAGKRVLLLGAGGAARAVAFTLVQAGVASLTIANRRPANGASLARDLAKVTACSLANVALEEGSLARQLSTTDLLINALPVGMYPEVDSMPPVKKAWLRPPLIVCDLIYNPFETKLLQIAAAQGCSVLNGVGMLVHQGAAAFKIWTGQEAPVAVMRATLLQHLT